MTHHFRGDIQAVAIPGIISEHGLSMSFLSCGLRRQGFFFLEHILNREGRAYSIKAKNGYDPNVERLRSIYDMGSKASAFFWLST